MYVGGEQARNSDRIQMRYYHQRSFFLCIQSSQKVKDAIEMKTKRITFGLKIFKPKNVVFNEWINRKFIMAFLFKSIGINCSKWASKIFLFYYFYAKFILFMHSKGIVSSQYLLC